MQNNSAPLAMKLKRIALLAVLVAAVVVMFMIGLVAIVVIVGIGLVYMVANKLFGLKTPTGFQHSSHTQSKAPEYTAPKQPTDDTTKPRVMDADFEVIDDK